MTDVEKAMSISNLEMNQNGKMLLAALAIMTTESRRNQTPDEVLNDVLALANKMFERDGTAIGELSYIMDKCAPLFKEIAYERLRQIDEFGNQQHGLTVWGAILGEEVGEVNNAVLQLEFGVVELNRRMRALKHLRNELVQVAAVCVAWCESLDEREIPDVIQKLIV